MLCVHPLLTEQLQLASAPSIDDQHGPVVARQGAQSEVQCGLCDAKEVGVHCLLVSDVQRLADIVLGELRREERVGVEHDVEDEPVARRGQQIPAMSRPGRRSAALLLCSSGVGRQLGGGEGGRLLHPEAEVDHHHARYSTEGQ